MNELFLLYLWTRLDSIHAMLFTLTFFGCVAVVMTTLSGAFLRQDNSVGSPSHGTGLKLHSHAKKLAAFVMFLGVLNVLTPTKTDAAIIAGGWLVKEAATSEVAKNIGERTYKLIMGKLDEELEKLQPKKAEKK